MTTPASSARVETPAEWAARVVAEHGPIPDHTLQGIAARFRRAHQSPVAHTPLGARDASQPTPSARAG